MLFLLIVYRLKQKYGNITLNLRVISTINTSSTKAAIRRMFQKQLKQCNFIRKCKPNNSLHVVLQAKFTNANKMLIAQSLCAFLALARLDFFSFLCFCSFFFNLTDTCIASPLFFIIMRKKATYRFYMFGRYFFPSTISIFQATERFLPTKLRCCTCGRIKDIASSNLKSTDFMFRGC